MVLSMRSPVSDRTAAAEVEIKAERLPIHHGNGHFLIDERLWKGLSGPFGNIQEPTAG
jgi:hypothetical protein